MFKISINQIYLGTSSRLYFILHLLCNTQRWTLHLTSFFVESDQNEHRLLFYAFSYRKLAGIGVNELLIFRSLYRLKQTLMIQNWFINIYSKLVTFKTIKREKVSNLMVFIVDSNRQKIYWSNLDCGHIYFFQFSMLTFLWGVSLRVLLTENR